MGMERIRESVSSVWAKALLGLIIVSFVLTGVNSYLFSRADTAPAKVNGEEISRAQFDKAYEQQRQRMEQQLGGMFAQLASDPTYLASFRRQVLDQLINETLLKQWITKLGMRVSDDAVRDAIRAMPGFQVNGEFSNDVYLSRLRTQGMSVAEFRELIRSSLAMDTLVGGVSSSAFVSPAEAELLQQLKAQTRDVRSVVVDAAPFVAKAEVKDDAINGYYLANPQLFQSPAKVGVEYVVLRLQDLAATVAQPDDASISSYYDEHKAEYSQPEERRVAHILLTGDDALAQAEAIAKELAAGGDFAALAARDSKDPGSSARGGELTWLTPKSFDPAFAAAAFALPDVGAVSQPVRSAFGVHLIKLLEVRGGSVRPLAEVKADIITAMTRQQAQDLYFAKQQQLVNAAFENPDSLTEVAKAADLSVLTAAPFAANAAPAALANDTVLAVLFNEEFAMAGQVSELLEPSDEISVFVRPTEFKAPSMLPLEEVKAQIVTTLQQQQGAADAQALAESLLNALLQGKTDEWQQLLTANGLSVAEVAGVGRESGNLDPALRAAAFELARPVAGQLSAKVVALGGGKSAVVAVTQVTDAAAVTADKSVQEQLANSLGRSALEGAVAMLRDQAEISYPASL